MDKRKKIVTIGGGSGHYMLLSGLRDVEDADITAVVSMADSGGSTGRLRDEMGVLPPGDILKCVLALSRDRGPARKILQRRFNTESKLNGHSVGNMLLTMLSEYAGSFPEGVSALSTVLGAKGQVLPVTIDKATLVAELSDGSRLYGESAIDVPRGDQREKIVKTFLVPHSNKAIEVYPPVIRALAEADCVILGPGDLYTSITPNFLVEGIRETFASIGAKVIYIANIMTKFGETDNFTGKDFIVSLENFIGRKIDAAVFNSGAPSREILEEYKKQKAAPVIMDEDGEWEGRKIIKEDMLSLGGGIVRHDSKKTANLISRLIK